MWLNSPSSLVSVTKEVDSLFPRLIFVVGTRFKSRGISDGGNVSNFVETEQILWSKNHTSSVLLVRGSVPAFWEQRIKGGGQTEVFKTRRPEATYHAFSAHFDRLTESKCSKSSLTYALETTER